MNGKLQNKKHFPLICAALGTLGFFGYGLIAGLLGDLYPRMGMNLPFSLFLIPFMITIMLMLLGFITRKNLGRFLISGFIFYVVFLIAFLFLGADSPLGGFLGIYMTDYATIISMVAMLVAGGNFIGIFLYGRKAWPFFTLIYFTFGLLFGGAMSLFHHNSGFYFVLLTTAIGSSIGVSLGLYSDNLKRGNRGDYLKKAQKGKYNKIILAVIAFGIVIGFGVSRIDRIRMITLENPDQAIIFNSPALETAIREYYELDQEEIRWRDIGYRTDLIIESSSLSDEITALSDLHWFVNLEKIQLFGRKISGNINDLDMLSRLTMLIMPETNVSGDIEVLISCPALEVIDLTGTLVEGDIGVFEYFPDSKLEYLNLSHTRVKGDIIHLASLENLTDLDLNNCDVTGDIDCFEGNQNLKMVDVSNTQVIGRWAEAE